MPCTKRSWLAYRLFAFDGVTEEPYKVLRSYSALKTKLKAIENCRQSEIRRIVPTFMRGVNDDQIGEMVRFAVENLDIVKGVNAQPIAFEGRIDNNS